MNTKITDVIPIVFAGFVGFVIKAGFEYFTLKEVPSYVFLISTFFFLIILIFIFIEIKKLKVSQDYINWEIKENAGKQNKGFKLATSAEIVEYTSIYLKKAKRFRVIGEGRQDIAEIKNQEAKNINNYYKAIRNRLGKSSGGSQGKLIFQRITTRDLKENFKTHLKSCLTLAEKNNHNYSISFIEDFEISFTYYVIDDSFLSLQILNPNSQGQMDYNFAFICLDKQTINEFIKHFDRIWTDRYFISSIHKLNEELSVVSPIVNQVSKIKKYINKIPYDSVAMNHAASEINQTYQRLLGLSNYILDIDHKVANGKLLSVFKSYISLLRENDYYHTVSFYEFWEEMAETDDTGFLEGNSEALINGASLKRIFIINEDSLISLKDNNLDVKKQLQLIDEFNKIKSILKINYNLKKDFPETYDFEVMFCNKERYNGYLHQYFNFAILKKGNQKVLFTPNYNKYLRNRKEVGSTRLCFFHTDRKKHPNFDNNYNEIIRYEKFYGDVKKEFNQQKKISIDHRDKFIHWVKTDNDSTITSAL